MVVLEMTKNERCKLKKNVTLSCSPRPLSAVLTHSSCQMFFFNSARIKYWIYHIKSIWVNKRAKDKLIVTEWDSKFQMQVFLLF